MMQKTKDKNTLPPLVLADFEDGNWHATSFAVDYLWEKQHRVSILQTFKKPDFGHFMTRDLNYQLKEITLNGLRRLKNKLMSDYGFEAGNVEIFSMEGELSQVLQYKFEPYSKYNLVLCTYSLFEELSRMQNKYLEKLIGTTKYPLFIIPKEFKKGHAKKVLLVGNATKCPSYQLVKKITQICKGTNSKLEVLFVLGKTHGEITDDIKGKYAQCFGELDMSIHHTKNSSICKGMNKYLGNRQRDLIVIENEQA